MAATVNKVLSIASDEVGYLEKATNAYLDDKTANAGYNNYTKYSRDLLNWIGSPYAQGVAWCDMFVDWCFIKAYGIDKAKQLLGGWSAYCPTSVQYFKNMGCWYNYPKKGDVIFFYDSSGDYGHTGIVYDVDNSYVYTIEGNTSSSAGVVPNGGGVFRKAYALTYGRIAGYGRPKYEVAPTPVIKGIMYTKKLPILNEKRPVLKIGMKSIHVQRLQKFLNWYYNNKVVNGKKLAQDCIFGYNTKCGVMRFQQDMFPNDPSEWDGEFGQKSLAKAKTVKK